MSTLTTSLQYCIGISCQCNKARKRNKRHPDWKGRNKTVFIQKQHNCLCITPLQSIKKLLELLGEFRKCFRIKDQYIKINRIFIY